MKNLSFINLRLNFCDTCFIYIQQFSMFKNKIYKYFTIETIKIFFIILFAFTSIAWTVRAVNFLDLVVENGHSFAAYTKYSLLNITGIMTKFIPISFLTALILTINKFERQNEFLIVWMSGIKKIEITNLILKISLVVFLFQILFAVFITPYALYKSRTIISSEKFSSFNSVSRPNTFNDSIKNLTIYFEKINDKNQMQNIIIKDDGNNLKNLVSNNNATTNTVIIAKSGYLKEDDLILFNGIIQTLDEQDKIYNISFEKTLINNDGALNSRSIIVPKLQETLTTNLVYCLINKSENEEICPYTLSIEVIETLSRRLGMPLYIPLISLICSFLLLNTKSLKLRQYIFFSIGIFVIVSAEILLRFSGLSLKTFIAYFALPVIFTFLIYFYLYKNLKFERI